MSSKPSREKVREQHARLRAQGLQPIQLWVPDVRSPASGWKRGASRWPFH